MKIRFFPWPYLPQRDLDDRNNNKFSNGNSISKIGFSSRNSGNNKVEIIFTITSILEFIHSFIQLYKEPHN